MKDLEHAKIARLRAYTPYSHFKVGAAIRLKDGTVVYGANVENAALGLSNCAERSALFSLISQGYDPKDVIQVTVVADTDKPVSPCGSCRQVLHELLPQDTKVVLANLKGDIKDTTTNDLLPYAFETFNDDKA